MAWTNSTDDMIESAWGIIANAGGGDWEKETPEWHEAAEAWRDRYHAYLAVAQPPRPDEESVPDARL